jgi:hypothetical protein
MHNWVSQQDEEDEEAQSNNVAVEAQFWVFPFLITAFKYLLGEV